MKTCMHCGLVACLSLLALKTMAAPVPAGYCPVEYIEATGTQYIDTGFYPNGRMKLEADFAFKDTTTLQQRVFGTQEDDAHYLTTSVYINGSGLLAWAIKDGTGQWRSMQVAPTTDRMRVVVDGGEPRVTLHKVANGTKLYDTLTDYGELKTRDSHQRASHWPILLFANNKTTPNDIQTSYVTNFSKAILFSFKISEAGKTVRSFVPCVRAADSAVGMYEEVTGKFFADAAGGNFVAGPVLDWVNAELAADGTSLSVKCNASDRARKLYLAYGFADKAGDSAKWDALVELGTVAAGATTFAATLPDAVGYARPNFRLLLSSAFTSADYVQDGMIFQLDAIENGGRGTHTTSTAGWTELVSGKTITWSGKGTPVVGEKSITIDGPYFTTTVAGASAAIQSGAFTAQVAMNQTPNKWVMYQTVIQFGPGNSNRELKLDTRRQGEAGYVQTGEYTFGGLQYRRTGWHNDSTINPANYFAGQDILATIACDGNKAKLIIDDAAEAFFTTASGGATANDDTMKFACEQGSERYYPMTAYGVRLYSRTLSFTEIAKNNAVDKERFSGVFATVSPLMTVARPVKAKIRDGATADVSFTASARPQRLYFVWGRTDAGAASTNGWDGAALLAEVPAGTGSYAGLALPAAAAMARYGRFLLAYADMSSADYGADGLMLQLDGIENFSAGVHKAAITNWTDLVCGREIHTYKGTSWGSVAEPKDLAYGGMPAVGEKSIDFAASNVFYQAEIPGLKEALAKKSITVQMFMKPQSFTQYEGLFQIGDQAHRQLQADARKEGTISKQAFVSVLQYAASGWAGDKTMIPNGNLRDQQFGHEVLTTVTVDSSGAHIWYDDEKAPAHTNAGNGVVPTMNKFTIGGYLTSPIYKMDLYAVRIYSRTLTADEIAANDRLDRARFLGGETPYSAASELLECYRGFSIMIR